MNTSKCFLILRVTVVVIMMIGVASQSLANDAYEPNNSRTAAYYHLANERTWLSTLLGLGVQSDEDWYQIYVNNDRLVVDCRFTHANGDIDIQVTDSSGTVVATSNSTTDNEFIDYAPPSSWEIYYIRVYGEGKGNFYDLFWDDLGSSDDDYEENDISATATDRTTDERVWLSTTSSLGVQNDWDWYEIDVNFGALRVLVDCRFTHADGNISMQLLNSSGTSVLATAATSTDNEFIDYTVSSSGTYYILIFGTDSGNTYDLWWDDISPDDDYYEQNDTQATAFNLSAYERTWLASNSSIGFGRGIQSDYDYYQISVSPGEERVLVDCRFSHADGNINIVLYNESGALQALSWSTTDNEFIDYTVPNSGTYYIRVYGANAGNTYDLWWDDISPDDAYEPNDSRTAAWYPGANKDRNIGWETTWLSAMAGQGRQYDEDWYEILVDPAGYEYVSVECQFTHANGNIDISLYDSSGSYLTGSSTNTDHESIGYTVSGPGTYYIRVYGANAGNAYDLWWDDLAPPSYLLWTK